MTNSQNTLKVRTTGEISAILSVTGALIGVLSVASLFFVKSFGSALIILLVPIVYALCAYLISVKYKIAIFMNVICCD